MPPPFNINETSPAASSLISSYPADEQANRAEIEEWLSFISDPATGMIREEVLPPATASAVPTGSKMLFIQTAAPTGWTKDTTHNNKALRIVNGTAGSGGTASFSSVFTSRTPTGSNTSATAGGSISTTAVTGTIGDTTATGSISNTTAGGTVNATTAGGTVGGTALTVANLPSHTHSISASGTTSSNGAHTHTFPVTANVGGQNTAREGDSNSSGTETTSSNGAHTHTVTVTGTSGSAGSGTTHTHTFTGSSHSHTFSGASHGHTFSGVAHDHSFTSPAHGHNFTGASHNHTWTGDAMDFAVQYVDAIICTKS